MISDRCARTVFAQRRSVFCVRMVRDTPQACIHPINAIKFLIEWKSIYFSRNSRVTLNDAFQLSASEITVWTVSRITGSSG
ncbi:hypothetical protein PCAR4_60333 [Paraburkholderia caribensis]|nr:hypothetical protein PCAR4_60333 [Paraburkholderia caribensis]